MLDIIQGEKQPFEFNLTSKKSGGPFDLTGNIEIEVCFKSGTTIVTKKKTLSEITVVGSPELGQISGDLEVADTDSLPSTENGDVEIKIDFGGGDIKKAQILGAFKVTEKIC